jgi:hypothetical protein
MMTKHYEAEMLEMYIAISAKMIIQVIAAHPHGKLEVTTQDMIGEITNDLTVKLSVIIGL